jgi:hypothetical protein
MTYEERRSVVERDDTVTSDPLAPRRMAVVRETESATVRPSGSTLASRVVTVVFGVIQGLLLARIVLLLLDANRDNAIVAAVLAISQLFVAPFEGMFNTDSVASGGSVLDVAAIVALVALTIVELLVLAVVRIPRRREDY